MLRSVLDPQIKCIVLEMDFQQGHCIHGSLYPGSRRTLQDLTCCIAQIRSEFHFRSRSPLTQSAGRKQENPYICSALVTSSSLQLYRIFDLNHFYFMPMIAMQHCRSKCSSLLILLANITLISKKKRCLQKNRMKLFNLFIYFLFRVQLNIVSAQQRDQHTSNTIPELIKPLGISDCRIWCQEEVLARLFQ